MSAPKSDTATIEARKFRLQELLAEGKTQREAAEILKGEEFPADVRTLRRDVTSLRGQWGEKNMTAFEVWRAEHIAELEKLRTQLQDFLIPPEKRIELALKIIAQDAKLKGTEAATRSENVNVNLDGDAIGPYRQFVLASRGLDAEQVEQLLTLAREMPRKPFVQVAPPKSSPLWDVPQLTEGTDEDA